MIEVEVVTGEQPVHVTLVVGVEQDPVTRWIEDAMQCDGQFNEPQVRAEVLDRRTDLFDQKPPDFPGHLSQLPGIEITQFRGRIGYSE